MSKIIDIGIDFDIRDSFSAGLNALKNKLKGIGTQTNKIKKQAQGLFDDFKLGAKKASGGLHDFSLKNMQLYEGLESQVPFLGSLTEYMSNPYLAAAAAVTALITGVIMLGSHLIEVSKEASQNQTQIRLMFGITGEELDKLTAKTMALGKVFGKETEEIRTAANAMSKEFEISGNEAAEVLEKVMLGTGGNADLQWVKEYSTQLRAAGYSAQESGAMIVQSFQQGFYDDKALDTIKEAELRLKEMPTAASEALNKVGIDSQALSNQMKTGALSTKDAIGLISSEMQGMDLQQQQELIAAVFGGAGEDLGKRGLMLFKDMNLNLDQLIDKQDPYVQKMQKRLKLEEAINSEVLKFSGTFTGISNFFDTMILQAKLLFYETINKAMNFINTNADRFAAIWEIIKIIITPTVLTVKAIGFAVWELIKLIGTRLYQAFQLITSAMMGLLKLWDWLKAKVAELWESIGGKKLVEELFGEGSMWDDMGKKIMNSISAVTGAAKRAFEIVNNLLAGDFDLAGDNWEKLKKDFKTDMAGEQTIKVNKEPVVPPTTEEEKTEDNQNLSTTKNSVAPENMFGGGGSSSGGGTKSITVNVANNITFNVANAVDDLEELQYKIEELLMRSIRNVESSY